MNEEQLSREIAAKNYKSRFWVFVASFMFSTGLYLILKPQFENEPVENLIWRALFFGVFFGLVFQFSARHLNGVNLKPWKSEKSLSKWKAACSEEKIEQSFSVAKAGYFPIPGVFIICGVNYYFVPHRGDKMKRFSKESVGKVKFSVADFNTQGKQRTLSFNAPEKTHRFVIFAENEREIGGYLL